MHTEVDPVLTEMQSGGSPVPTGTHVGSDRTGGSLGERVLTGCSGTRSQDAAKEGPDHGPQEATEVGDGSPESSSDVHHRAKRRYRSLRWRHEEELTWLA